MPDSNKHFWEAFNNKDFEEAQAHFRQLAPEEQQAVFAKLFQKSQFQRKPSIISIHRGKLHPNKTFDDSL